MESKAQKAALADVEERIKYLIKVLEGKEYYGKEYYLERDILSRLNTISNNIKEYGLEEKLFTDVVEKIYDSLMKRGCFSAAASFAKKYGL